MPERVVSMPMAAITEDGSEIQITLESDAGTRTELRFKAEDFEWFMGKATQLAMGARGRKLTIGDHFAVQAVVVEDGGAQAPVGGGKVILALRSDTGLLFQFSLLPAFADRLRAELYQAAKRAAKEKAKPRH